MGPFSLSLSLSLSLSIWFLITFQPYYHLERERKKKGQKIVKDCRMKKTIIERGKIRRSRKGKGRKKIDKSDDGKCKKNGSVK